MEKNVKFFPVNLKLDLDGRSNLLAATHQFFEEAYSIQQIPKIFGINSSKENTKIWEQNLVKTRFETLDFPDGKQ